MGTEADNHDMVGVYLIGSNLCDFGLVTVTEAIPRQTTWLKTPVLTVVCGIQGKSYYLPLFMSMK